MKANNQQLTLEIQLIPKPLWGKSLHKLLTRSKWDMIRRPVFSRARGTCQICGVKAKELSCHEVWSYDDRECVQRLEEFKAVCKNCHLVIHIDQAERLINSGAALNMGEIIEHFCGVNCVDTDTFYSHQAETAALYESRSAKGWYIDYGKYNSWVPDQLYGSKDLGVPW